MRPKTAIVVSETVNRISEKRIFLPGFPILPLLAPILLPSGASKNADGKAVRQGSQTSPQAFRKKSEAKKNPSNKRSATAARWTEERDDAYTIRTEHLHYCGNGVWKTRGIKVG